MNKVININLELELTSKDNIIDILTDKISVNKTSVELADNVIVETVKLEEGLGFLDSVTVTMLMSFGMGVSSGIVANAIYSALGKGIQKISLNGRRIRPNKDELIKALETAIELAKIESE